MSSQTYIWDISNPNTPDITLASVSPVTSISFNHKNTDHIAGGCENGLVCLWDTKQKEKGGFFLQTRAPTEGSHRGPVTDLVWLSSKSGSQFVTTSTDGLVLWWDTRKLVAPTEPCLDSIELCEKPSFPDDGKYIVIGGTAIEYLPEASVSYLL